MLPLDPPRPVSAWLRPDQIGAVRALLEANNLRAVRVGAPEPTEASLVARAFEAQPIDEPRRFFAEAEERACLVFDTRPWGDDDNPETAHAVRDAAARHAPVIVTDPLPVSAGALHRGGWLPEPGRVTPIDALKLAPRLRLDPALVAAVEMLDAFGGAAGVRSMTLEWTGPGALLPLGARLLLAVEVLHALLDTPEEITAAYTPSPEALASGAARRAGGVSFRGLQGEMACLARLPGGRSATMTLSDQDPVGRLGLTLAGAAGVLRADADGVRFWAAAPSSVEAAAERPAPRGPETGDPTTGAGDLDRLARAVRVCMDPAAPSSPPIDAPAVYATGEAAILSARTREGERPDTLRRLAERG